MKKLFAMLLLLVLLCTGCTRDAETPTPSVPQKTNSYLSVHFIDVDQADSMLLVTDDTAVLIDAGRIESGRDVLSYIKDRKIPDLDLVVSTHPHGDHLGGIPTVMNGMPVEEIWSSHDDYDTSLFKSFKNAASAQGLSVTQTEPGTVFEEDGLKITVIGPLFGNDTYNDLNDTSLVLMVEFGELKFLFTGDMEAFAEKQLVNSGVDLDADVLKVGHHGSYSSTSQVFLDAVTPTYAVICCGWENEYGHPHDAPMNRLNKANVELYRTDTMGSVVLFTDGASVNFMQEKSGVSAAARRTYTPADATAPSMTAPPMPTISLPTVDDAAAEPKLPDNLGSIIGVGLAGVAVVAVVVVLVIRKRK